MAKIEPDGPMQTWKAHGDTWFIDGTDRPKVFIRQLPEGMIVVTSYVEDGQTRVHTVLDGHSFSRWYNTSPITTRAAALLVNRFMKDIYEAQP